MWHVGVKLVITQTQQIQVYVFPARLVDMVYLERHQVTALVRALQGISAQWGVFHQTKRHVVALNITVKKEHRNDRRLRMDTTRRHWYRK